MATPTPYRSLPPEKRVALVTHVIKASKEGRMIFVQRMMSRGGFRAQTLLQWPAEKLASEVVRMKAETSNDELDLLHLLFVELEPAIQITFLDAAGVERGAKAVREKHGEDGMRYLRTLARYASEGWPGIEQQA
jgi:hypothetical protein